MGIELTCTRCAQRLRVPDDSAGKKAQCPQCGAILDVPGLVAAEIVAAPSTWSENPYRPPANVGYDTPTGAQAPPSGAVTAVAIVNYIAGGLQLLCGGSIVLTGTLAHDVMKQVEADDPNVRDVFGDFPLALVVVIVGLVIVGFSLPLFAAGYGVQQRRGWGRMLTLVLGGFSALGAMFNLLAMNPVFLINAGYSLLVFVVLLNRKYAAEFG